MKGKKSKAWRALVVVLIAVYLPRIHMIRVRRRLQRLA